MVSQHGDGVTSLALRGPSTVIGTTSGGGGGHARGGSLHSSSRSRRYNRSHAGGASFIPQNEFPIFSHSGDVDIVVRVATGHEHRYLLHRHILTRCSGFFEASTSHEWSRAQPVPELPAPAMAGLIEGRTAQGGELARLDDRGSSNEQDLLRDYDNLFRIMYNYPPLLDGINIADSYVQCKSLLTLADQYDALAVVGPRVDHHLLQFQSRLWRQIAKYPISYLRAALPESVVDIIEDKVDELEETVSRVEARLFRLTLTARGGGMVTPQSGYLEWLAVSLFRQWLAENTAPPVMVGVPARRGGAGVQGEGFVGCWGGRSGRNSSGGGVGRRCEYGECSREWWWWGNVGTGSVQAVVPSVPMPHLATLGRMLNDDRAQ
ncbi:hypothetical protein N0V88_000012 [Collariella sp. IMI 366227]|nr:hypothetical protein N0V88_000012 [Collariella sp. IMI 366227]